MSEDNKSNDCCSCSVSKPKSQEPAAEGKPRRGFLGMLIAAGFGTVALAAPIGAGIASLLSPLRWKSQAGQLCRITLLTDVPEDGTPQKFPVVMPIRKDAWNIFHSKIAGKIFLRRVGKDKVEAFSDICPHAGCAINFDTDHERFECPCHEAYFSLDGKRTQKDSQSPRDMDRLDTVEIRGGEVWVKFEKFKGGISKKVAES
ncbi:MAG: Rieske 2Fe-2S domain-containing protein [Planctomycetia bacterium]|jgi:Rieske Fe-S protein